MHQPAGTAPSEQADDLRRRAEALVAEALPGPVGGGEFELRAWADRSSRPLQSGLRLQPGFKVGDFTLIDLLGRGGMGEVWRAEQGSLSRQVALKLLLPERVSPASLEFFAREARAGGRLTHAGIVSIYGTGESDGLHWIAMELVDNACDLRSVIEGLGDQRDLGPKHYRNTAQLVARVAEALQYAHEAEVIHRDIKPGNILIGPDGEPRVTDFGLAKVLDENSISVQGDLIGTYFYMSPEVASGKRTRVGHHSDVFSLGVVLYELLTRVRPFDGDTSQQIVNKITTEDPPDPVRLRSRVPPELSVICAKALEKEPASRYQSMRELAEDLRRFLANEPILARPAGTVERAAKWVRRNRAAAGMIALLLSSVTVVSALGMAAVRNASELSLANAQLETEHARATTVSTFLERAIRTPPRLVGEAALEYLQSHAPAAAESEQELFEWERVLESIDFHELATSVLEAQVLRPLVDSLSSAEQFDQETEARIRSAIAAAYFHPMAMYEQAAEQQRLVVQRLEEVLPPADEDLLQARSDLAVICGMGGQLEEATRITKQVASVHESVGGRSTLVFAKSMETLAYLEMRQGHHQAAQQLYRETIAIQAVLLGEDHHDVQLLKRNLGQALREGGQLAEAKSIFLELVHGNLPEGELSFEGYVLTGLGHAHFALEEYEEAEVCYRRGVELLEPDLGRTHPFTVSAQKGLEKVLVQLGR